MLEKEIKVVRPAISIDEIRKRLMNLGAKYTGTKKIIDIYLESKNTAEILRIRNEDGKSYLMYKSEDLAEGNTKERIEYSVGVEGNLGFLLQALGLREKVKIRKAREEFELEDMKIALDRTDSLGIIFEVEYNSQNNLERVLREFGFSESRFEKRSTYQLLREKNLGEYDSVERGIDAVVSKIKSNVKRRPDRIFLVGVAGASGSGKTTVAKRIAERIFDTRVLSLDSYYRENALELARGLGNNFDHPSLIDFEKIRRDLKDLKGSKPIKVPKYSFSDGRREGYEDFGPSRVIVAEGIFAFYPPVNNFYDLKVSTYSSIHLNLIRRLTRDVERTGQSEDQILNQVTATVFPMYTYHVEPHLKDADIKISNTFNPLNMRSSENQIKITGLDFDQVKSKLKNEIQLVKRSSQTDTVFAPKDNYNPSERIKVRSEGNVNLLSFKIESKGSGSSRERKEYECIVGNNAVNNLILLGYEILETIEKEREEYRGPSYSIRFDDVKGRGKFIEIEGGEKEIENLINRLGIERGKITKKSYSEMLYRKKQ